MAGLSCLPWPLHIIKRKIGHYYDREKIGQHRKKETLEPKKVRIAFAFLLLLLLGFKKTKGKNLPKQESLVFLGMTVHRVGETAENQRKTREKTKVAENQMFWLDFCAKKKDCAYPLRKRSKVVF